MDVHRGSRIKVNFAGRPYSAVVINTDCPAPADPSKVKFADAPDNLPDITEAELKLWKFIADYYLCTIGEVYKIACPSVIVKQDQTARIARLHEALEDKLAKAESLIGHPVSDLYAAIGRPTKGSLYASSCNGPGEDGELYYDGFTVYTYKEDG